MVEILFNLEMNKRLIIFVLIFFSSCSNVKQDKSLVKKSENITHYSHEDSLRLKEGLLPMCLDWNRDSVILGIRDKFGTWKKIDDTTSNLNVVENIYYSLRAEDKDLIRKEIQKKINDSTIIQETDFYRQFIDDSSKHVGLFYSIDYNKTQRTCMLDTFDYVKYRQLIQEDKLTQQKREFEKKFAKENGLIVDGTAEIEHFFKQLQTYHKIHSIDTEDVKEIINRIFDYD